MDHQHRRGSGFDQARERDLPRLRRGTASIETRASLFHIEDRAEENPRVRPRIGRFRRGLRPRHRSIQQRRSRDVRPRPGPDHDQLCGIRVDLVRVLADIADRRPTVRLGIGRFRTGVLRASAILDERRDRPPLHVIKGMRGELNQPRAVPEAVVEKQHHRMGASLGEGFREEKVEGQFRPSGAFA